MLNVTLWIKSSYSALQEERHAIERALQEVYGVTCWYQSNDGDHVSIHDVTFEQSQMLAKILKALRMVQMLTRGLSGDVEIIIQGRNDARPEWAKPFHFGGE